MEKSKKEEKMKDCEEKYLDLFKQNLSFICVQKKFVQMVLVNIQNNQLITKKLFCVNCVQNFHSTGRDFNYIDVKYITLKEEHFLYADTNFSDFNPIYEEVQCEQCTNQIKDYWFVHSKPCNTCINLIDDNQFMKDAINSIEDLPKELKFENFIRNFENFEYDWDDADFMTKFCINKTKHVIWAEPDSFQKVLGDNQPVKMEVKNTFNPKSSSDWLKCYELYDELDRAKAIINEIKEFFKQ